MNTEANLENTASVTPGQRLRQARENMGLTQQTVAERLCLKLSTVREIEDDNTSPDLAPTFLRGYIRSYARLVHIPESELLPALDKQVVPRIANVASMQGFSLGKPRKKRDGWLMSFTWLVVLVVLGLTGAWWWQNHQAQQQEINSMVDHATAAAQENPDALATTSQDGGNSQSIDLTQIAPASPLETPKDVTSSPVATATGNGVASAMPAPSTPLANGTTATHAPASTETQAGTSNNSGIHAGTHAGTQGAASDNNTQGAAPVSGNTIAMTFTADCWLEVFDAAGKKLFSGVQRSGNALNLSGQPPYRLKIGAPAAVQIQYQGKPVDMSRFVKSNQIARLTLAAE